MQPKPISPFPDTPGDIPTVSRPPVTSTSKEIPSEYKDEDSWKDKTPAYANCAFERVGGFSFPVCIDSGSSISIIDGNFANEYLPNCRREKCSSFELKGLGNAIVTESLYTTLYFKNLNTATFIPMPMKFFVASNNTPVIMGNDVLVTQKSNIDLHQGILTFKGISGKIRLTCRVPQEMMQFPVARVKATCTISPGHMVELPIEIEGSVDTESYLLEPDSEYELPLMIARSVGRTDSRDHRVQVMNTTNTPVELRSGQPIATIHPTIERSNTRTLRTAHVNSISSTDNDEREFLSIMEEFNVNPELSANERKQMLEVLYQNRRAFAYGIHKLGQTDLVKMTLDTGDSPPISSPPYHASPHGRKVIEETIAELLTDDVIEMSDSPWASPAILVHQKGKDRFCIDYRKINTVLKADQYPIPRVDDILTQFSGMAYYTTFDANKGFHQVEVDEKDREKTAFRTHVGLHQFKRMPFGLKTGPSVFQRLTDRILGRYKWQIALVYIDDIIIYSKTFDQHAKDVDTILKLVTKSGITLSPKKSYVAHHSIKALGHRVSNLGIGTLEETVRAVKEYPRPHNVKSLQRFLGLAVYYRKFVKNFA